MQLKKIEISNFKSIKDPAEIKLDGNIVTILGKNGSGKTNILKAVQHFFSVRTTFGQETSVNFTASIELDDKDLETLKNTQKEIANISSSIIMVKLDNKDPYKFHIYCESINNAVEQVRKNIMNLSEQITDELNEYKNRIDSLEINKSSTVNVNTIGLKTSTISCQDSIIERIKGLMDFQVKQINTYINETFEKDNIVINLRNNPPYFLLNEYPELEIQYTPVKLSPIESTFININDKSLREEVKKINLKLKCHTDRIHNLTLSFEEQASKFQEILCLNKLANQVLDHDGVARNSLIDKIRGEINKKCYYLDNEHTLIFGSDDILNLSANYLNNLRNPIIKCFIRHCRNINMIKEEIDDLNLEEYSDAYAESLRSEFERFMLKNAAGFDEKMYKSITVKILNNKFKLFIVEKDGKEIDFNSTSLGRR